MQKQQNGQLSRVESTVAPVILEFARNVLNAITPEFQVEDLRDFVNKRFKVAPASPDRILRSLRKQGMIQYVVVSRSKSLYRIISVVPDVALEPLKMPEIPADIVANINRGADNTTTYVEPDNSLQRAKEILKSIDSLRRAKEILKSITDFVSVSSEGGEVLWDILSALRGPDSNNFQLKDETTIPLRYAAGFRECSPFARYTPGYISQPGALNENHPMDSAHFRKHFRDAVEGLKKLGLDVTK